MGTKPGVVISIVIGMLFYAGVIGLIIRASVRWSKKQLAKKSDALLSGMPGAKPVGETKRPTLYSGSETDYDVNGRKVTVTVFYQNRSYIRASLKIAGGPYPYLTIFPEGKFERFGKAVGLNREVQSGDQAFDDRAYLDTIDTEEHVRKAVEPAGVRGAILDLLDLGYRVQLSDKGVEAFQVMRAGDSIDGSKSSLAVAALGKLADTLPSFSGMELQSPRTATRVAFALVLVFSWVVGIATAGACSGAVDRTLDPGITFAAFVLGGGFIWVLYVASMVAIVQGRSYAMRTVTIGAVLSLIGIPMGAGALILQYNQSFDTSAPVVRPLTVLLHKNVKKSGCRIEVAGWGSEPRARLRMSHKGGDEVLPAGAPITVRTHPGALGFEWYEAIAADGR